MAERAVTDPNPTPETEAFWDAAKKGKFLVKACNSCGQAHWYPRSACPFCFSTDTAWQEASGKGVVYSFSVLRRAPIPYVTAYVQLAEGPCMMTNIVDTDFAAIKVGQKVELVWKSSPSGYAVPMFRLGDG